MKAIISLLAVMGFAAVSQATCPDITYGTYNCTVTVAGTTSTAAFQIAKSTDSQGRQVVIANADQDGGVPMLCDNASETDTTCSAADRKDPTVDAQCTSQLGAGMESVAVTTNTSSISAIQEKATMDLVQISGGQSQRILDMTVQIGKVAQNKITYVINLTSEGQTMAMSANCTAQ